MIVRRLLIVSGSAALHLGWAGLALMLGGASGTSAILIDLVADVTGQTIEHERPNPSPPPLPAGVTPQGHRAVRWMAAAPNGPPASSASMSMPAPREERRPASSADSQAGPGAQAERSAQARPGARAEPAASASGPAEPLPALVAADTPLATAESPPEVATRHDGGGAAGGVIGRGASDLAGRGEASGSAGGEARATPFGSASGTVATPHSSGDGSSLAAVTAERRGGISAEYGPYLEGFRRRVQESLEYPLAARRRGLSGTVELEVLLEPSGRVTAARLVSSSSHAVLDDAALRAVQGLAAEPFPERLPRRSLRIRLPLTFELR